jgi:UDP-N-acetylglucosamine 4,6-dehydratase
MDNKTVLITGGTGSFGRKFTEMVFDRYKPRKLIIFSRDEYKQYEMSKTFRPSKLPIRYFLGDIRDKARLYRAFEDVDYVIHAAALKQVPALEYNPMEAVKTNVMGADNIVEAAIDTRVEKVVALSTDKAVNPINLYGATKLVAEKTFIAANAYAGRKVKFAVVRYGNVVGSRGSVIPLFLDFKRQGAKEFPITDERMTRFWITLEESVDLVLKALQNTVGGETFIPIIPSMKVVDLAKAIEPKAVLKTIGIRPGEKIHETLVSEDEARTTKIFQGCYVILPQFYENKEVHEIYDMYPGVAENFIYRSDINEKWLSGDELKEMVKTI